MRDHTAICQRMKTATGSTNDISLMNELQNRGLVSDNCESIYDVPDCDLVRADDLLVRSAGKSHGEQNESARNL